MQYPEQERTRKILRFLHQGLQRQYARGAGGLLLFFVHKDEDYEYRREVEGLIRKHKKKKGGKGCKGGCLHRFAFLGRTKGQHLGTAWSQYAYGTRNAAIKARAVSRLHQSRLAKRLGTTTPLPCAEGSNYSRVRDRKIPH
jgi:hypothetical protein